MSTLHEKTSPMMAQWHACKRQAQDALLLFRLGDFYEAFYEDAVLMSRELDLTLTKRQEIPMSGIPFHASEGYLDRLVAKGFKVAIAEQMEDPKTTKGLVHREIVRIVTPGTLVNSSLLHDKTHNFLASLTQLNALFGLSLLDLSTGELCVLELENIQSVLDELFRSKPKELLISEKCHQRHANVLKEFIETTRCLCSVKEEWHYEHQTAYATLTKHFRVHSLDGFGLKGMTAAVNAAAVLLHYVRDELGLPTEHIEHVRPEILTSYMAIDRTTQRHLELTESLHHSNETHTLLDILDETYTPMGARLLQHWLLHPLLSDVEIHERQEAIAAFTRTSQDLGAALKEIRDLERLVMRISTGYAIPRDLVALRLSLENVPVVVQTLESFQEKLIAEDRLACKDVSGLVQKIASTLTDAPPFRLTEGGVIRSGVDPLLDELRMLKTSSHDWIAHYQTSLRESTGIKTLKVCYTKAFGFSIEVSRGQAGKMPENFERRQTLVNAERFISPELKDYEHKILTAEEKITSLESTLFDALRQQIAERASDIRCIARAIARIDCLWGLARVAQKRQYSRPKIDHSSVLQIEGGRHPVLETCLPKGDFVPNDTCMSDQQRLLLITGPNMAGKSTYIRQTALIVILAQIGSFVPAKSAHIGIVDKVFSRIGASDDLSRGQSTFMVEMSETANILHNATSRSLVVLDEIGRGTSTYDGIAIAWSVAEYLLTTIGKQAKTLFATHYSELNQLEGQIPGAMNYNVAVHESSDGISFLRKIVPGGTDKSYGIHVAKLAGLPFAAVRKAQEMLAKMEKASPLTMTPVLGRPHTPRQRQLDLFSPPRPEEAIAEAILSDIRRSDIDQLTPLEALKKLAAWKKQLLT